MLKSILGPTLQIKAKTLRSSDWLEMTPPVNGIRMLCHFRKRSSVQPPRVTTGPLINRNVSVSDFVFGQLHVAFIGHCLWDSKSAATARLCRLTAVSVRRFLSAANFFLLPKPVQAFWG